MLNNILWDKIFKNMDETKLVSMSWRAYRKMKDLVAIISYSHEVWLDALIYILCLSGQSYWQNLLCPNDLSNNLGMITL